MTRQLTTDELAAARAWLADCSWAEDLDPNSAELDFDAMSDAEITRAVARHHDGGIDGFIATCNA